MNKLLAACCTALFACTSFSMKQEPSTQAIDQQLQKGAQEKAGTDEHLSWLPDKVAAVTGQSDVNAVDDLGNSRLHYAAFLLEIPSMVTLVQMGAQAALKNKQGQDTLNVLDEMIAKEKKPQAKLMLEKQRNVLLSTLARIDVKQKFLNDATLLHKAVYLQNGDLVKELLALKAPVNVRTLSGMTPLHLGTLTMDNGSSFQLLKQLVAAGANPDIVTNDRETALHTLTQSHLQQNLTSNQTAAAFNNAFKLVIDAMYSLNTQDKRGNTVLHLLASSKNARLDSITYNILKYLLEKGANTNLQNKDGFTPLHIAVLMGNLDLVRLLLKHGADPRIRSYVPRTRTQVQSGQEPLPGKTPLEMAQELYAAQSSPALMQINFALTDVLNTLPQFEPTKEKSGTSALGTLSKSISNLAGSLWDLKKGWL